MLIFGRYFKIALPIFLACFILSFASFLYSPLNKALFVLIIFAAFVLSLKKIDYGLYILLGELFIGSKGYLFYFDYGGVSISLRIGLFFVVFLAWFIKLFKGGFRKNVREIFNSDNLWQYYGLLFIFIAWGFIWGLIRGNGTRQVFFDFNAWPYFGMALIGWSVIKSKEEVQKIIQILMAAVAVITIKTFFLLYVFSHKMEGIARLLYRWLRLYLIGEITLMDNGFYRIFFQSQIYVLVGFFILFAFLVWQWKKESGGLGFKKYWLHCLLASGLLSSILISFSRSFWVGLLGGGVILLIFLFIFRTSFWKMLKICGGGLLILFFSGALIWITMKIPLGGSVSNFSFSSMFEDRLTDLNEAAVRSRWDLLSPLGKAIAKHPIIGSGFGTAVTYKSSDPRALQFSKDGKFTTTAFEWGYLDIWLKIGLAGLLVYSFLILKICQKGWRAIKDNVSQETFFMPIGLMCGLMALLATNFFSPYLNHPLGIGYVVLCGIIPVTLTKTLKT